MARPLVISIHGIRTRGVWQKEFTIALNDAGFHHVPIDYGFFSSLRLLMPGARRKRVDWFRDEYEKTMRGRSGLPSVVAHSFGTYIVTEAMRIYPEVRFDQMILCGSIVRTDYPWSEVIKRGGVRRVLNDYGRQDFWAKSVFWGVPDTGPSGSEGFSDDAGGAVLQRAHPDWRHSDFFYPLHFVDSWASFLKGGLPKVVGTPAPQGRNLRPLLLALILATLLVAGAVLVQNTRNENDVPAPMTTTSSTNIEPLSYVAGTVIDEASSAPIADAIVAIEGGDAKRSDNAGTFHLPAREGDVVLVVRRKGYVTAQVNVSAPTSSVSVALKREGA